MSLGVGGGGSTLMVSSTGSILFAAGLGEKLTNAWVGTISWAIAVLMRKIDLGVSKTA